MRAVVQRVNGAVVSVEGRETGSVGCGLVIFLGVGRDDDAADAAWMADKVAGLRIFSDDDGLMNCSVLDVGGAVLAVSQFTLYGDCRKGRRPSFTTAAPPETAKYLYHLFCEELDKRGVPVSTGIFQAEMRVLADNNGPVSILLDSKRLF